MNYTKNLWSKINIFNALHSHEMTVGDFIRQCSDEELSEFLSVHFLKGEHGEEIYRVLTQPAKILIED